MIPNGSGCLTNHSIQVKIYCKEFSDEVRDGEAFNMKMFSHRCSSERNLDARRDIEMRIYALFDLSPELFTCCSLASCPTTQITHRFTLIQLYQNDYIIFVIFNLFDILSTLKENENNNFLFILKYMYGASMLPIHVLQFTFPRASPSTMCRQSDQVLR